MLPELFSIGPFTVYSYGLMTAIGIIAAITLGEHEAKRSGVGEDGYILGLGLAAVIGGLQIIVLVYSFATDLSGSCYYKRISDEWLRCIWGLDWRCAYRLFVLQKEKNRFLENI